MTALPETTWRKICDPAPAVTFVCRTCKGTDVVRDAWAVWNEELQQWELGSLYDHAHCNTCDGETKLEEKVL